MMAPLPVIPLPGPALRPDVIDLDIEASGLHHGSFPVEFGWCDDGLVGTSFLVRPHPTWSRSVDWSSEAEHVHGISWERLMDEGVPPEEAVERIVEATRARTVLSDATDLETRWTARLFMAVGVRMPFRYEPNMDEVGEALLQSGPPDTVLTRFAVAEEMADQAFPHVHRSLPDAMGTAALRRFAMDPAYLELVTRVMAEVGHGAGSGRQTATLALMGGWGS